MCCPDAQLFYMETAPGTVPQPQHPRPPDGGRVDSRPLAETFRANARRWKRWRALGRADMAAGVMTALAIIFLATSLLRGPPEAGNPAGFVMIAPLVAVGFFIALIAMFLERERHGLVRALLSVGTVVLAIAAWIYAGRVPIGTLTVAYWIPAVLGAASAIIIARAKLAVARLKAG